MFDSSASRMLQSVQSSAQPATQQWLQVPGDSATQSDPQQLQQSSNQQSTNGVSDQQKLDVFESVLSEMEAEKQSTAPVVDATAVSQTQPPAAPPQSTPAQPVGYSSSIHKEQAPGMIASAELPGGMQYVESEPKSPEIPAEVEAYLQKVEEEPTELPKEIVIAAQEHAAANAPRNLPQDVKVLPVTQAQMEEGKKKNTSFSIKWLVTFSEKLAEMFKGKAVYRNE